MRLYARVIVVAAGTMALPATLLAQESASGQAQPLAFRSAIELALKNSTTTGLSRADQQRAHFAVTQARDVFLPQTVFGAGIGASYGFPLSLGNPPPPTGRRLPGQMTRILCLDGGLTRPCEAGWLVTAEQEYFFFG